MGLSKNPFHPNMCDVKMYGLIGSNIGSSSEEKIVKKMITLIVDTIGPIELSANTESNNASAATVVIAIAAKPKAAKYLQKISFIG